MTKEKRHINIPIFIPHLGCPNKCVFCNQHAISGACSFKKENIVAEIDAILSTINPMETDCEIAFFGGSFTGIDRETMLYCLNTAESYVKRGLVAGIRMSTRPDYISREILSVISRYSVREIELGIQSFSEKTLNACRRGHTGEDVVQACRLLNDANVPFVGQMMIGLPFSDLAAEIACAEKICDLGASGCRIYPTIVFKNTELANMVEQGVYQPLSLDDAIARSAAVLDVFVRRKVRCLRIGLCESENLHVKEYYAGPNHPAFGELVGNALYYDRMCTEIEKRLSNLEQNVVFEVPRGDISLAVGQKQANKIKIERKYNVKSVKFIENPDLIRYNIKLVRKSTE